MTHGMFMGFFEYGRAERPLCLRGLWVYCRGSRGRQAFVFARFPNNLGMIAFHIFQAIPFLYELRELLDWCASPTCSCCTIHMRIPRQKRGFLRVSCCTICMRMPRPQGCLTAR